jgi:C-terminal processing protease CtpA/Prc
MSTIFKENSLGVIIGTKSGGGASSITPILLPNGSAFTMSSNSINAYTTETGDPENPFDFHSNEFGIEPDVYLSLADIYDSDQLLFILNSQE